ncbi:MAG: alpha/beta hydrolase, partial [Lachnospiraceae bacterium]|nr:alpha/beta hydrolase [Lachnospiraceae bacterium]
SEPVPWALACVTEKVFCAAGKEEWYLMWNHAYSGPEPFAGSASVSEARYNYYQEKRSREPLFQMNAVSYGWLWQAVRLNYYLQRKAWRGIACPVLVFQAECETYVSKKEQERFVRKLSRRRRGKAKLVRVRGVKHEIFNAGAQVLERYWYKVLKERA